MNKTIERARREHCALNQGFPDIEYINELSNIETILKNYKELTNKPVILYGRTHKNAQALIDTICKNYKEVKITNLEDEKKVKALEIIKTKEIDIRLFNECPSLDEYNNWASDESQLTKEEYDLLKEVLL